MQLPKKRQAAPGQTINPVQPLTNFANQDFNGLRPFSAGLNQSLYGNTQKQTYPGYGVLQQAPTQSQPTTQPGIGGIQPFQVGSAPATATATPTPQPTGPAPGTSLGELKKRNAETSQALTKTRNETKALQSRNDQLARQNLQNNANINAVQTITGDGQANWAQFGTVDDAQRMNQQNPGSVKWDSYLDSQGVSPQAQAQARQLGSGGSAFGASIDTFPGASHGNESLESLTRSGSKEALDTFNRRTSDAEALENALARPTGEDRQRSQESQDRLARGKEYKAKRLEQEMERRLAQAEERNKRKADRSKDRTTGAELGTHSSRRYQDDRANAMADKETDRAHGLMDNQQAHEKELAEIEAQSRKDIAALTPSAQAGDPRALNNLTKIHTDQISRLDDQINTLSDRLNDTALQGDKNAGQRQQIQQQIDELEAEREVHGKQLQRATFENVINSGRITPQQSNINKAWAMRIGQLDPAGNPRDYEAIVGSLADMGVELPPLAEGEVHDPNALLSAYLQFMDTTYGYDGITDYLIKR